MGKGVLGQIEIGMDVCIKAVLPLGPADTRLVASPCDVKKGILTRPAH